MSPAQTNEVRRRLLADPTPFSAWPALVSELRAQMEADVEPHAAPVQGIVKRSQQLFRDSYCGDNAAMRSDQISFGLSGGF